MTRNYNYDIVIAIGLHIYFEDNQFPTISHVLYTLECVVVSY